MCGEPHWSSASLCWRRQGGAGQYSSGEEACQQVPRSVQTYVKEPRADSAVPPHHGVRGMTPMYSQPFSNQGPFGAYPGQSAFPPQPYPQPYYQQSYGQPQWNPLPPTTQQPWPAAAPMGPATYAPDDVAGYHGSRRGAGTGQHR